MTVRNAATVLWCLVGLYVLVLFLAARAGAAFRPWRPSVTTVGAEPGLMVGDTIRMGVRPAWWRAALEWADWRLIAGDQPEWLSERVVVAITPETITLDHAWSGPIGKVRLVRRGSRAVRLAAGRGQQ